MKHLLFMVSLFVILHSSFANSATIQLPKTGQTSCYDTSGTTVTCAGTGQDGEIQAGVAWPNPRFTANNDQTVTDNLTGLIWSKDANPAAATTTWQGALDYIKTLNSSKYLGYSDWRLPNINEMKSLVNQGQSSPATWLNSLGFSNVSSVYDYYWSATRYANKYGYAWIVSMYDGNVHSSYGDPYPKHYLWPVRSGQSGAFGSLTLSKTGQTTCYDTSGTTISCTGTGQDGELQTGTTWPTPRFTDNSLSNSTEKTVTDNLTGLIWSKNANPAATTKTWQGALDYIKTLNSSNYLGHDDWRLPNINELQSLINQVQTTPATWLNSQGFSNVQSKSGGYWSGSTYAQYTFNAWYVPMDYGFVDSSSKGFSKNVWPVRSGQSGAFGSFTLSSAAITFTATNSGTQSTPVTLTLANNGKVDVAVSATTITGTDATQFTVATGGSTPCASLTPTLTAGASCTLSVTFAPISAGSKTASLLVTSNDSTVHMIKSDLTGIALPDSTPPKVAITSPANGASGNILWQIDGTASDNNNSLTKVEVQIYNGVRYISATGQFSTPAVWLTATTSDNWLHWTLDTSNFAMNSVDGSYTITARSTDGSGNLSTPAVVSFTRGNGTGSGTTMLLVSKSEAAAGTVSSSPTGISCDTLCGATGASYTTGASVSLTATPAAGYYFLNWSNCDTPNSNICTVSVSTNHPTVTANFSKKSVTNLSLTPHTQTLTLNQNQTVSGRLAAVPDAPSADLNNQTISITIKGPDGQQSLDTKTTDNNGIWSLPLSLFTKKGTYFIGATYVGAEKMMNSSSDIATILVAKSAGYAIIVHGKISSNEGLLDHLHTTDMIKDKLIQRLFLDDDVTYLKSSATTAPSKTDVQNAITTWAKNKLNTSPAPLVVVLVDHGDPSQFHIGNDYITPQDLAGWMTTLDSSLTPDARAENQIVVIGTCYSGSFIPALSRPGRIIITSADAKEQSIRGTMVGYADDKTTKIRQGEAFLEELFSRLGSGKYLGDAFKQAVDVLRQKAKNNASITC